MSNPEQSLLLDNTRVRYDIYSCNEDDSIRYVLGKTGTKYMACVVLNSSTANRYKPDVTIAKVEEVSSRTGFDAFYMLNLYPCRMTHFNELPYESQVEIYSRNLDEIERIFKQHPGISVWASWGVSILSRKYFIAAAVEVLNLGNKHNVKWLNYGSLTTNGHPKHPSRLSYAWEFKELDTKTYIEQLKILLGKDEQKEQSR
jgi:hypothetical protein